MCSCGASGFHLCNRADRAAYADRMKAAYAENPSTVYPELQCDSETRNHACVRDAGHDGKHFDNGVMWDAPQQLYVSALTQKIHTDQNCSVTRRNHARNLETSSTAKELAALNYTGCKRCGAYDALRGADIEQD